MVGDSCTCCACVSVHCASVPASPAMNVRRLMQSPHRPRQGKDNMARELEKSGSKIAQVRGRDTSYPAPPHRSVRAAFPHTACMGLSLSRVTPFFAPCLFILLFDPRRKHSFVPTAYLHRRRAQRRSRTALLQRCRRLVLDGREHGGRLL